MTAWVGLTVYHSNDFRIHLTVYMFICFFIIFSVLGYVLSDENEYRLVRDLMTSYDKRIRPSQNHSKPLNVTFGVALAQIIDVVSQARPIFMYLLFEYDIFVI